MSCLKGVANASYRHGHCPGGVGSPTWSSWRSLRDRCENPRATKYRLYGGRGITVCERWSRFENFLADMGERPPGMTIDRIDSNGNYEPGNCRWATNEKQNRNRSITKLTADAVQEIHGRCEHGETQTSVARRFGIDQSMVSLIRSGRNWADQKEVR